jgi:hypothetical protein
MRPPRIFSKFALTFPSLCDTPYSSMRPEANNVTTGPDGNASAAARLAVFWAELARSRSRLVAAVCHRRTMACLAPKWRSPFRPALRPPRASFRPRPSQYRWIKVDKGQ